MEFLNDLFKLLEQGDYMSWMRSISARVLSVTKPNPTGTSLEDHPRTCRPLPFTRALLYLEPSWSTYPRCPGGFGSSQCVTL